MRNSETLWTFETANFRIEWNISPDDDVDTSFDETGETLEKLNSGEWFAFVSEMRCVHKQTGIELATDYLGGSIYANPKDFRDHIGAQGRWGSYFKDMVHSVCKDARKTLSQLQGVAA